MTLAINHKFVTLKSDGTDATLLRPSNWNDTHAITMATNNLLGRASAGGGTVEELPTSAAVIALLASADLATFLAALGISPPTTGDGRITLKTSPASGWLMMDDGTFGDASSGASNRANADTLALFTLIYNNIADADAPLLTSGGGATTRGALGSAATAWAAHCRMTLPKQLGRAIVGAGAGATLTARALGSKFGAEAVTLVTGNLPPYTPGGTIATTTTSALSKYMISSISTGPLQYGGTGTGGQIDTTPTGWNSAWTGTPQGGLSTPFGVVQPSAAWNVMVKL